MTMPTHGPADRCPKWRQIPHLAWVIARAFLGNPWPTRAGTPRALASAALVYLPLLAGAALRRHVAATPNGGGVVVFWTGWRDRLTLIGVGLGGIALVATAVDLVTGLAYDTVSTLTGVLAVTALLAILIAPILVAAVDQVVMLARRPNRGAGSAERYTTQLRRSGHTAWAIGPWAAWSPGHRAGTTLVDQLLPEVPPDVWLVAVARNTHIANALDARGFLTPAGGGLLRVRPPAGQTPPPPA